MAKEIVSDKKNEDPNNIVHDEPTLAKLLEAAYVLQEHNRELQAMDLGFELKRDQLEARNKALSELEDAQASRQDKTQDNRADKSEDKKKTASAPTHTRSASASAALAPEASPSPAGDYTSTLAQIVETQHHIQIRHLQLDQAMSLVAGRVTEIARASGASIGLLRERTVRYGAVAGQKTLPAGSEVRMEKALCLPCLRTGQVFRCVDVNPEFLVDTEECHRRGIQSLIAVPIFHDDEVAGGLELYYATAHAFNDQDIHTCQLMAGLVTEALAREQELTLKKSMVAERAAVLEALEKLPNLSSLVDPKAAREATAATAVPACPKCGYQAASDEPFCGHCGSSRRAAYERPSMQSKVASLWEMQEARKKDDSSTPGGPLTSRDEDRDKTQNAEMMESPAIETEAQPETSSLETAALVPTTLVPTVQDSTNLDSTILAPTILDTTNLASMNEGLLAPTNPDGATTAGEDHAEDSVEHPPDWSSAASAREFLEQVAPKPVGTMSRFWKARRGDVFLAVAVLVVVCVIRWGIWSSNSTGAPSSASAAASHRKLDPTADLSAWDRMLIDMGLADPPEVPEDKGNPATQVWVDLHTALYYCPGTDLYGKTPTGKFATQRDAELDEFQPAYRKVCD